MKFLYLFLSYILFFTVIGCSGSDPAPVPPVVPPVVITPITVPANKTFAHPGLLHTQVDFDRIKTKVSTNTAPWISGWNMLIANNHAQLSYNPNPTVKIIRGGNSKEEPLPDNYSNAMNDAAAAYQTAIRWKVTGDVAYANKSIQILNAWASTCTSISGDPNYLLAAGIYGYEFANAAEIMRDYSGWSANDFNAFKKWMIDVFYPPCYSFLQTHMNTCPTYIWANWDLCSIATIMSIGILTDDVAKYTYAINYLMTGVGNGQLIKTINYFHAKSSNDDINLAQLQESGRDQGHALLSVGLLSVIAQTAYSQGEDVYGWNDNAILKAAEYSAKFNYANLDVPFHTYTNCNNETHTVVANDASRGNRRPIWERLRSHYIKRKGMTARYLNMAANIHATEGGGGNFGSTSGGFDDLGFGTLLYSLE